MLLRQSNRAPSRRPYFSLHYRRLSDRAASLNESPSSPPLFILLGRLPERVSTARLVAFFPMFWRKTTLAEFQQAENAGAPSSSPRHVCQRASAESGSVGRILRMPSAAQVIGFCHGSSISLERVYSRRRLSVPLATGFINNRSPPHDAAFGRLKPDVTIKKPERSCRRAAGLQLAIRRVQGTDAPHGTIPLMKLLLIQDDLSCSRTAVSCCHRMSSIANRRLPASCAAARNRDPRGTRRCPLRLLANC